MRADFNLRSHPESATGVRQRSDPRTEVSNCRAGAPRQAIASAKAAACRPQEGNGAYLDICELQVDLESHVGSDNGRRQRFRAKEGGKRRTPRPQSLRDSVAAGPMSNAKAGAAVCDRRLHSRRFGGRRPLHERDKNETGRRYLVESKRPLGTSYLCGPVNTAQEFSYDD